MRAQIDGRRGDPGGRGAQARARCCARSTGLPKPLIGRVQGNAFGGGVGLMAVCDVAIAAAGARFGLTETRLGLIPATIGPYVVARMGAAMARRVFFSARLFDAAEAVTLGLAAQAVAPDALDAAVEAEVVALSRLRARRGRRGQGAGARLGTPIDDAVIDATIAALVARWESPEAAEGIAAFFDKRPPDWSAS